MLSTNTEQSSVECLFEILLGTYGADFVRKWDGVSKPVMKEVWARGLNGYMLSDIERGLESLGKFPPNLEEFKELCRPQLDYERAFLIAIEQMRKRETNTDIWPYPAIYWAACKIGNDLFVHPYSALKSRWNAALDESMASVKSGELPATVPLRRAELPAPGKTQLTKEQKQRNIQRLRDMLAESRLVNESNLVDA